METSAHQIQDWLWAKAKLLQIILDKLIVICMGFFLCMCSVAVNIRSQNIHIRITFLLNANVPIKQSQLGFSINKMCPNGGIISKYW